VYGGVDPSGIVSPLRDRMRLDTTTCPATCLNLVVANRPEQELMQLEDVFDGGRQGSPES
jgi:hypothetical protein